MKRIPTWFVFVVGAALAVGCVAYGFLFAFPHPDFIDGNPEHAYRIRNTLFAVGCAGLMLLLASFVLAVVRGDPKRENQK
jgi:hypothetical protein